MMLAPASRILRKPPRTTSRSTARGRSSGTHMSASAVSGRPPMAWTPDSALAAAIWPKSYGSSTTGVKKSTVCTSASPRPCAKTPASSIEDWSTRTRRSRRAPSIPPNTVRRSSGPSFEAQPAHATSAVSRTSMRRRSLAARRPVRGVAGGAGAVVESAPTPDRHRVDLDARAKREPRGRERGARRRIAREGPGVDLVHLLEVLHVGEEYRGLHHVRECEPSPRQHGLEIAQDLLGLLGDRSTPELARGRIECHLTCGEDHLVTA